MNTKYLSFLLIPSLLSISACHKSKSADQVLDPENTQTAQVTEPLMDVNQAPEQNTQENQIEDSADTIPVSAELKTLLEHAESGNQTDIENAASYLLDESHPDYDYVKACTLLGKLENFSTPVLEYQRGRCDLIAATINQDDTLRQAAVMHITNAAEQNLEDALVYLINTGLDPTMHSYQLLKALYEKRAQETSALNNQYNYIAILLNVPGNPPKDALEKMQKLADQNYPDAVVYIASNMINNPKTQAKALRMMDSAADLGNSKAIAHLLSHYDFQARTAKNPQIAEQHAQKALQYAEKIPGHTLACRIMTEMSIDENDSELKSRAQSQLVNCIQHTEPNRMACDNIKHFLLDNNEINALPDTLRNDSLDALILCYTNVIRHGNEIPRILNELQQSNDEIIQSLKAMKH